MNIKRAGFLSLISLLGLGGCASMSADECVTSDWHAIGYEDGARGYTADQLGNRRKACAKHGITPDFESYRAGREEGLRQYCQPSRGFSLGSGGARYNGVCPGDLEADFVDCIRCAPGLMARRPESMPRNTSWKMSTTGFAARRHN
jgi:hypothetical protein